jgi:hypothetical protein
MQQWHMRSRGKHRHRTGRFDPSICDPKLGQGTSTVTLSNVTAKESASATVTATPSYTSIDAETSIFNGFGGNVTPIPSFTPVKYGNLKFGGSLLSSFSPTKTEMYDGSVLQVATSAISTTGGFSTIFKHI